MPRALETPVLIVGAGPVGLTLALDLAFHGIRSIIVEQRPPDEKATPRANHVSARAMETYRRLGIAADIREAGLPGDYPSDIVWMTTMTGYELTRIGLPCRDKAGAEGFVDTGWPTPEPQHKINQMFLEPILRRHVERNDRTTLLYRTRLEGFTQGEAGVTARLRDLDTGETFEIAAASMVGCDGGNSSVRKAIGARFSGDAALTRVVSLHIVAPDLLSRLNNRPAHRYFLVNQQQRGSAVCLNGKDLWSLHLMLPSAESDPAELDRGRAVRGITGIDDLDYEVFAEDSWTGRRLLADRFRQGRVFLAGDAAHIWVPNAGYGMNAGIADAENLAWRLSAVLNGWGGQALLDGYERERHPITDQVSNFAKDLAVRNGASQFKAPSPDLASPGPDGEAARSELGAALYELNLPQFTPAGLNFAYFYDRSPDISYDGEAAPEYSLGDYTPSTVPGCRLPHFVRAGISLYDDLGCEFTLLRLDPEADVAPLMSAANERGLPVKILDIDRSQAGEAYRHALVLARPDRHIAWRGDAIPHDAGGLLDLVTGNCG